jgi:DNA-binding NtrC family response regulator
MDREPSSDLQIRSLDQASPSLEVSRNSAMPIVLVATVDPDIRSSLSSLLEAQPVRVTWAKSVEEVRASLAREDVSACFCGFWLVDGTYRDVIRLLKARPAEIPAIIACAPACPHEYRNYLAALNIRAFDFICFPYRIDDLERVLRSAISTHDLSERKQDSSQGGWNESSDQSQLRKVG